ncbi:MAG TPA: FIST N-terminal domain-containing protein [Polyangiaceae bacterium]
MQIAQHVWTHSTETLVGGGRGECKNPQLVLVFAAPEWLRDPETWQRLRARWPSAQLVAGSTAGEISETHVLDDSLVATALQFDKSQIRTERVALSDGTSSEALGQQLGERLLGEGLRHVFVLSDGLKVNGSALVRGLSERLPAGVSLTGGLCGDGARFERTHLGLNDFDAGECAIGIGFYGESLRVGMASLGGWDPFGPERRVTRSEGNVLFELDGQPALALYQKYLGEHAAGLPGSGLLFPLSVRARQEDTAVVRTILAVDHERGSLTFAGDVPIGHYARLMRANFDRLVDGACGAARASSSELGSIDSQLAILISCVGRKLVLKQRIEEEVEGVQRVLGDSVVMTGFYSYGEISPFTPGARCELHNQTMTITTLAEA